ncbi:MAG: hypothetical protein Q8R00_00380 [Candidatus Nanoarchaeia archaeon]|nr:hypothetical protein [Candidatus Nanoarchaeia archaeon]
MGDFDSIPKKGKTRRKAFRNSERVERLKGNSDYPNGSKRKLRYLTTSADFFEVPEAHKRFYNLLNPQQKIIFGFIYINPLEEILNEAKYLGNRVTGELTKKRVELLSVRELNEELARYEKYLQTCNKPNNSDILRIAFNFKQENPRFVNYFLERINELVDKTVYNKKRLSNLLYGITP